MKIKFLIMLTTFHLASCQENDTKKCPESGFCINDASLYYNQKPIAIGDKVEDFANALGKQDRIVKDSVGGQVITDYYWDAKKLKANSHPANDFVMLIPMVKSDSGEGYVEDFSGEGYVKYKNIGEIEKKYGKFDRVDKKEMPLDVTEFYVWDKLGVNMAVHNGIVEQVNIYPIPLFWATDLDLTDKTASVEGPELPYREPNDEVISKRQDDKKLFNRYPKGIYEGNFSFDGNIINIKEIGNKGWEKAIAKLKIQGEEYDPPGDSEGWSRFLKPSYDLYAEIKRYNGRRQNQDLDLIKSIEIYRVVDAK